MYKDLKLDDIIHDIKEIEKLSNMLDINAKSIIFLNDCIVSITKILKKYKQEDMIDNEYKINNKDSLDKLMLLDKIIENFLLKNSNDINNNIKETNNTYIENIVSLLDEIFNFYYSYYNYAVENGNLFKNKRESLKYLYLDKIVQTKLKQKNGILCNLNNIELLFTEEIEDLTTIKVLKNNNYDYNTNLDKKIILLHPEIFYTNRITYTYYENVIILDNKIVNSLLNINFKKYFVKDYIVNNIINNNCIVKMNNKLTKDKLSNSNYVSHRESSNIYNYISNIYNYFYDSVSENVSKNINVDNYIYISQTLLNNFDISKKFLHRFINGDEITKEDLYKIMKSHNILFKNHFDCETEIYSKNYNIDFKTIVNNYIDSLPNDLTIDIKNIKNENRNKRVIFNFLSYVFKNKIELENRNIVKLKNILCSHNYIDGNILAYKLTIDSQYYDYSSYSNYVNFTKKSEREMKKELENIHSFYDIDNFYDEAKTITNQLVELNYDNVFFNKSILDKYNITIDKDKYIKKHGFLHNLISIFKDTNIKKDNDNTNLIQEDFINNEVEKNISYNMVENTFNNFDIDNQYNELNKKFNILEQDTYKQYLSQIDMNNIKLLKEEIQLFIKENNILYHISNNEEKKLIQDTVSNKILEVNIIIDEKIEIVKKEIKNKLSISERIINDCKINIL